MHCDASWNQIESNRWHNLLTLLNVLIIDHMEELLKWAKHIITKLTMHSGCHTWTLIPFVLDIKCFCMKGWSFRGLRNNTSGWKHNSPVKVHRSSIWCKNLHQHCIHSTFTAQNHRLLWIHYIHKHLLPNASVMGPWGNKSRKMQFCSVGPNMRTLRKLTMDVGHLFCSRSPACAEAQSKHEHMVEASGSHRGLKLPVSKLSTLQQWWGRAGMCVCSWGGLHWALHRTCHRWRK